MANFLDNKVAVITGSGQGVGSAIAIIMAKEGAKVVTNNRWQGTPGGDAETTAREIIDMGGKAVPFFGDVSNFGVARQLIQTAVDNFGQLDILVNNAGILGRYNMVWDMTEEDWDRCVDISLKGSFNCIHHASGLMRQQRWGRIINTTSANALGGYGISPYCAAKAGIIGLTKAVAWELGAYGITCNCYGPTTRTRFSTGEERETRLKKMCEEGLITEEQYKEQTTQSEPERAAAPLVAYLCTDEAANINGQSFRVKWGIVSIYSEQAEEKSIAKEEAPWTIAELVKLVPEVLLKRY